MSAERFGLVGAPPAWVGFVLDPHRGWLAQTRAASRWDALRRLRDLPVPRHWPRKALPYGVSPDAPAAAEGGAACAN